MTETEVGFVGERKLTTGPQFFPFPVINLQSGGWEGGLWPPETLCQGTSVPGLAQSRRKQSKSATGVALGLGPCWPLLSPGTWAPGAPGD